MAAHFVRSSSEAVLSMPYSGDHLSLIAALNPEPSNKLVGNGVPGPVSSNGLGCFRHQGGGPARHRQGVKLKIQRKTWNIRRPPWGSLACASSGPLLYYLCFLPSRLYSILSSSIPHSLVSDKPTLGLDIMFVWLFLVFSSRTAATAKHP